MRWPRRDWYPMTFWGGCCYGFLISNLIGLPVAGVVFVLHWAL